MENIILIAFGVVVFVTAVIGLAMFLNKKGWLADSDNDWIPDIIESKVSDVKTELAELKADLEATKDRLHKEVQDVGKAIKEVGNQLGDIPAAFSGKKRPGRKTNGKK
ncbi:MAG: hypothetical protein ACKVJK_00165 [Methylophagaceae bacterium]|jgi:hypothetical protein|tara:strand:- start:926 stop:1249 length:324 start_codon:yes stop_codon:yes gene_type:complete